MPNLFAINLDAVSQLAYTCQAWQCRAGGYAGGVIRFTGEYRPGSSGAGDAKFIGWKISEFCDNEEPLQIDGLVVDFREMHYEWGDNLSVARARRLLIAGKPVLSVVRPENWDAFAGCLGIEDLRTDIDEAVEEVNSFLKRLP